MSWVDIQEKLSDKTMIPFVYGRYMQIVIDFSKDKSLTPPKPDRYFADEYTRRYLIQHYIAKKTPDEIVAEAKNILTKLMINIKRGKKDNGLCNFDSEYEFDGYSLYTGRCFQFLLDTDRRHNNIDNLVNETVWNIVDAAENLKQHLLIKSCGPYKLSYCDSEYCKDGCTWDGTSKRCDCGNRRCTFSSSTANLDQTSPRGYPECY